MNAYPEVVKKELDRLEENKQKIISYIPEALIAEEVMSEFPACRYVQVGVKEEPIYELRCDEPAPKQ